VRRSRRIRRGAADGDTVTREDFSSHENTVYIYAVDRRPSYSTIHHILLGVKGMPASPNLEESINYDPCQNQGSTPIRRLIANTL
jgi:hypothetical protein